MEVLPQQGPGTKTDEIDLRSSDVRQLKVPTAALRVVRLEHVPDLIDELPTQPWIAAIEHKTTNTDEVKIADDKKKSRKKWVSTAFRLTVTLALFVLLARSVSWSTLISTLIHVHHTYLLIGVGLGLLGVGLSAYVWRALLVGEGIQVDLARLVNLYLVGIAFNHFLPSSMGGDAVKMFYLGRESGNGSGSASAVLLSRVTGFLGMLTMAIPALILFHAYFKGELVIEFVLICVAVLGGISAALVLASFLPRISAKFLKGGWTKHKLFLTLLKVGTTLSISSRKPRPMGEAILFGLLFWVTTCLGYYVYGAALGLQIPLYFYLVAIPFASTIASLPISINGFGVRESLFLYLFATMHVLASSALLLALLMDAQRLIFGALGGFIYLTMKSN